MEKLTWVIRDVMDLCTNPMKHVKVTVILSGKVTIVFIWEIIFNLNVKQVNWNFTERNINTSVHFRKK